VGDKFVGCKPDLIFSVVIIFKMDVFGVAIFSIFFFILEKEYFVLYLTTKKGSPQRSCQLVLKAFDAFTAI
jgi:hypothetical protein